MIRVDGTCLLCYDSLRNKTGQEYYQNPERRGAMVKECVRFSVISRPGRFPAD